MLLTNIYIMHTLLSRFFILIFALPFLYAYLYWQSNRKGGAIEQRPVLSILKEVAEIKHELTSAQQEIERRKAAERERDETIRELQTTLLEVKTLRGLIPICANCKNIRDDQGYWQQIEAYIQTHSDAVFSHAPPSGGHKFAIPRQYTHEITIRPPAFVHLP